MCNKSVIKSIIKGIMVPILTMAMILPNSVPVMAALGPGGIREYLGEYNTNGAVPPSAATSLDSNGRLASVAYGDGHGHLSEGYLRDSPLNFTKHNTDGAQLLQNVSWGWSGENKEVGEQQNHATINTYFKVKGTIPRKQYRAVYIMSTCTSHGFNWVSAASTISYLITKYEHVDVITCAFHTVDEYRENSNQKRVAQGLINGSFNTVTEGYRANRYRVRYDVQDIECREWYKKNGNIKSRGLGITLKDMADKGLEEGFFHPNSEDFPKVLSDKGKRPEDFYIIKGMMSASGHSSALKKLKANGNVDDDALFRRQRGTDPDTSAAFFGGDRHSQGFELAAFEAYLKGDLPGGKRHTIEAPVDTDGNGTVDKYENGISHLYINVDGTGWMDKKDEPTGWMPGEGATQELNYSSHGGGYLKDVWSHLITLDDEGRYTSLGSTTKATESDGTLTSAGGMNKNMYNGTGPKRLPKGWNKYNEYINVIAGMCDPQLWKEQFGTGWGDKNGKNPYNTEINRQISFEGWRKGGSLSAVPTMESKKYDFKDITYWFAGCQTEWDKDNQYMDQTLIEGDRYEKNDSEMKKAVNDFWNSVPDKETAYTWVKTERYGSDKNQNKSGINLSMEGKQIRTYAESHKYTSPKSDIPTRIYYKAKSSFKNKKILPIVGEQLGVSGVEWKKTPNLCTVCGLYDNNKISDKYYDWVCKKCGNTISDQKSKPGSCTVQVPDGDSTKNCGGSYKKAGSAYYHCANCNTKYTTKKFPKASNGNMGFYIINNYGCRIYDEVREKLIKTDSNGAFSGFKNKGFGSGDGKGWYTGRNSRKIYGWMNENVIHPSHYSSSQGDEGLYQLVTRDGKQDGGSKVTQNNDNTFNPPKNRETWTERSNLVYPDYPNYISLPGPALPDYSGQLSIKTMHLDSTKTTIYNGFKGGIKSYQFKRCEDASANSKKNPLNAIGKGFSKNATPDFYRYSKDKDLNDIITWDMYIKPDTWYCLTMDVYVDPNVKAREPFNLLEYTQLSYGSAVNMLKGDVKATNNKPGTIKNKIYNGSIVDTKDNVYYAGAPALVKYLINDYIIYYHLGKVNPDKTIEGNTTGKDRHRQGVNSSVTNPNRVNVNTDRNYALNIVEYQNKSTSTGLKKEYTWSGHNYPTIATEKKEKYDYAKEDRINPASTTLVNYYRTKVLDKNGKSGMFDFLHTYIDSGTVGNYAPASGKDQGDSNDTRNPDALNGNVNTQVVKYNGKYNVFSPTASETNKTVRGWNYPGLSYTSHVLDDDAVNVKQAGKGGNDNDKIKIVGEYGDKEIYDTYLPFNEKNHCFLLTFDTNKYYATDASEKFATHLNPTSNIHYIMTDGGYKGKNMDSVATSEQAKNYSYKLPKSEENASGGFIQRYYSTYGTYTGNGYNITTDSKNNITNIVSRSGDTTLKGTMGVYYFGDYFRDANGKYVYYTKDATGKVTGDPVNYWDIRYGTTFPTRERDLAYGQWSEFPKVEAKGCTFIGWNSKKDGTGTWYSQNGGKNDIKFDGIVYSSKPLRIQEIKKNSRDWQSGLIPKTNATDSVASDTPGQEYTLYAIYADNTNVDGTAYARMPKLPTQDELKSTLGSGSTLSITYNSQTSWTTDQQIKGTYGYNNVLGSSYNTTNAKKLVNEKVYRKNTGDTAGMISLPSGKKRPKNHNTSGWTNTGAKKKNPVTGAEEDISYIPDDLLTVRVKGQDKATGVFRMVDFVAAWTKEKYGTLTSYMAGRTTVTPSPLKDTNRVTPDYTWTTTGNPEINIKTRVDGTNKDDITNPSLFTTDALKALKKDSSKYSENPTNYDIGFRIQGTTYVETSATSRQYTEAWSWNDGKVISNIPNKDGSNNTNITKLHHGMPAYDDRLRQVMKSSKIYDSVDNGEASADPNDHVVVKLDFTPPKSAEDPDAMIKRGRVENDGWVTNEKDLTIGEAVENRIPKEESRPGTVYEGMLTKFKVRYEDYNDDQFGDYKYMGDSAGIYGVYVLVRDPDTGTNNADGSWTPDPSIPIERQQKLYQMGIDPDLPYDYTWNTDLNILSAWYTLKVNLYTEFPAANRLVYQIFAIDNAGNISGGGPTEIGKKLNPDKDKLVDPDPPSNPAPSEVPEKGWFDNFSLKAILVTDEVNDKNDKEDTYEETSLNKNPEAGEVFFQAGDMGHFDIVTVGYAGLYNTESKWKLVGSDYTYTKTQRGDPTAIEINMYGDKTPKWAIELFGMKDWSKYGGEMGKEAHDEIINAVIPIKHNMGYVAGEDKLDKITDEPYWHPNGKLSNKYGTTKHLIERRITSTKTGEKIGEMIKPKYFSVPRWDSSLEETVLDTYYPGSSTYNKMLKVDNVPYSVHWTWKPEKDTSRGDIGGYGRYDYTKDKVTGDDEKDRQEGWEDKGTRIRIPPYYEMKIPKKEGGEVVTDRDGNVIHEIEAHPWTVYAYKNKAFRYKNLKYYIFDTWRNDLHYRVTHEDSSSRKH